MGTLRILKNTILKNLKSKSVSLIIFIIFWIVCCFISAQAKQARAQYEPSADHFKATLTIKRTDCKNADSVDTVPLDFGFDPNNRIQLNPVPPEPYGACIKAFFVQDPNITGFTALEEDSNQPINELNKELDEKRGSWEGWQNASFPLPTLESDKRWKATWGIKISYPDLMPYDPDAHPLEISWNWDPNELVSRPLKLQIGDTKINMHEQSSVTKDVVDKSIIKIVYGYNYEGNSALGIICVGGMTNEAELRGNFRAFIHLGDWTYINLKSKIEDPAENMRYIFFKGYHDINGDGHNDIFIDYRINQKEKIKKSIEEWVCEKWNCSGDIKPKMALLIIYLVDHGFMNGEISIDPYEEDPNNQRISAQELNEWLTFLENNLLMNGIYNYEILTIIEACYSKSFFEDLRSDHRVFIASAAETELADISNHGRDAFSHHFWQNIGNKQYDLYNAFDKASKEVKKQSPFFWAKDPPSEYLFLFNKVEYAPEPIIIPNILRVDSNFQHIDHFGYKAKFTVYADRPINKAWAAITPPGCSDEWCRFYSNPNECYHEEDDDKILSFSPNYYFLDPNTEICFYVQGDGTVVSGPYYLDPIIIPNILTVDPNFQHIDHFGYSAKFTVYADRPINKAWAAITPPGCSDEWCRFYSNPNECYHEGDDDKILSFSPNYYFLDPNTEICFYVQGDGTVVSGPYYLDPNIVKDNITFPSDPNALLDEYEPDNEPEEVKGFAGELQVHSFHDSDDVDWVKFTAFSGINYDIELVLFSPLAIDTNIIPFQVTIFTSEKEIGDIEFSKILEYYLYGNTRVDNARTYIKKWESLEDESEVIYLKIQPNENYHPPFIYRLHIISAIAKSNCYIFSGINNDTKDKIKEGISDLYLLNEYQKKFLPIWIKSNLIDGYHPCEPKYFYFHLQQEHSPSSFYNLYIGEERRGPDEEIYVPWNTNFIIWLDPNSYFTDTERPKKNCDLDCDGRPDPYELYNGMSPDYREILLHSGMNVFHYPFWGTSYDDEFTEIPAVNIYNIFYNPNSRFYDPNIADLMKICTFSEKENAWLCYSDQNSPDILLNNKSGCLIYLKSINDDNIISLPNNTESGDCFREALYDDPNKAKIELHSGINPVGLIGYKTLFDFDPFKSIGDGYFNSFSASYSLAETTSETNSMSFSSIMRYDHNQGKWQNSSLFFGRATGEKFPLRPDEGYLIYMANKGDPNSLKKIIWMPHQTLKDINYKIIVENE